MLFLPLAALAVSAALGAYSTWDARKKSKEAEKEAMNRLGPLADINLKSKQLDLDRALMMYEAWKEQYNNPIGLKPGQLYPTAAPIFKNAPYGSPQMAGMLRRGRRSAMKLAPNVQRMVALRSMAGIPISQDVSGIGMMVDRANQQSAAYRQALAGLGSAIGSFAGNKMMMNNMMDNQSKIDIVDRVAANPVPSADFQIAPLDVYGNNDYGYKWDFGGLG